MQSGSGTGREIPSGYGDNKIVLMARDPHTLYSYWEIQGETESIAEKDIRDKGYSDVRRILRLYDATGGESDAAVVMDLEITGAANSWYINGVEPGREWLIEIGFLCSSGDFFSLARSNVTITPSNKMSETCDEEWMCTKELYDELFIAAGGKEMGKSSFEFPSSDTFSSRMSSGSGSFILGE